jgi:hypothetical protein
MLAIRGSQAHAKADKTAAALLDRTRRMLRENGLADYRETCVEMLGCEALYGPHARPLPTREIILRIVVRHESAAGLGFLQRECASAGTSMGPGTRSSFQGRSDIQPVVRVHSFLLPKSLVREQVLLEEVVTPVPAPAAEAPAGPPLRACAAPETGQEEDGPPQHDGPLAVVTLQALAWARSGDKGDTENIGVIARRPEFLPLIRRQLGAKQVQAYFAHLAHGPVERFDVPGLHAVNFVLHDALGGGGMSSLRSDPLGKSYAQMLLDHPVQVPRSWVERGWIAPP